MKKILIFIFVLTMGASFSLNAQTISDALRFSRFEPFGTARNMGLGGTLYITGGDMSGIALNPAGVATFRKSRISFSIGNSTVQTESSFAGNSGSAVKSITGLHNIGLVSVNKPVGSDWKTINFSVNFIPLANFNQPFTYGGKTPGSISDRWLEQSLGRSPDQFNPFEEGLGANAGVLVLLDSTNWTYTTDYQDYNHGKKLYKKENIITRGALNRLNISFGGNYREKLQIGLGLNVNFLQYNAFKDYEEDALNDYGINYFKSLRLKDTLTTNGSGLSLNLGAIYRPVHPVFLSLAIETPTFWTLNDSYSRSLYYTYEESNGGTQFGEAKSPLGSFEYALKTPLRFNLGGAYIFGKRAMMLAGIEWTHYGNARFDLVKNSSDPGDLEYQKTLNTDLKDAYSSSFKYNLGTELGWRFLRLRGGLNFFQRPYANDRGFDSSWSWGIGVNSDYFFIDFSMLSYHRKSGYVPYLTKNKEVFPTQLVKLSTSQVNYCLTAGFRF